MSESAEQKQIVAWFRQAYPEYAMSLRVSQSGGYRGKGRTGAIRSAQVTAMGGITGESDIAILLKRGGFGALLIEHKAEDSQHTASKAQLDYIRYHNAIGNCAVVTRGVGMAMGAIKQYMGMGHEERQTDTTG
jgi:hypothetical protein